MRPTDASWATHGEAWDGISALIGRIYECAVDPGQWDDTLAQLIALFSPPDWDVAMLVWENAAPPSGRFVASAGVNPMVRNIYSQLYAGRNPWSQAILRQPAGRVVDTLDLMSREQFVESAIYRDFFKTWDLEQALAVVLDRRGGERLGLVMPGRANRDLDGLKRGLRIVAPHIQRAVRIGGLIGQANLRAMIAEAALDQAPNAMILVAPDLSVLSANAKARALISRGVLRVSQGKLDFVQAEDQRRLRTLADATEPASTAFQIDGPDDDQISVLGARIETRTATGSAGVLEGAGLILCFGMGKGAPLIRIDRLTAWFGLTPAEGLLAEALSKGATLADHAANRNVSINAQRFLLKSVFRKVGVSSQSQLVARLSALP